MGDGGGKGAKTVIGFQSITPAITVSLQHSRDAFSVPYSCPGVRDPLSAWSDIFWWGILMSRTADVAFTWLCSVFVLFELSAARV